MKEWIIGLTRVMDSFIADIYLSVREERPAVISIMFHNIFSDRKEINFNNVHPQQFMTVEVLRQFINSMLEGGYKFITPYQLKSCKTKPGKYLLLTFDDGYFNNSLALPVLKEFNVPGTFFISVNNIQYQKSFWWDVIYRKRLQQGENLRRVEDEIRGLKSLKNVEIEKYVSDLFGKNALQPVSDIDRPFSVNELMAFASNEEVVIGNHTMDHAILPNYSHSEGLKQIKQAQEKLKEWTGNAPEMIAYPDGAYDDQIVSLAAEAGLNSGITVQPGKNYLPINSSEKMFQLKRFVLWGNSGLAGQLKRFRSDIAILR